MPRGGIPLDAMDLPLLELDDAPLFEPDRHPFDDPSDLLFLASDPFPASDDPKSALVIDPFEAPLLPSCAQPAATESTHIVPRPTSIAPLELTPDAVDVAQTAVSLTLTQVPHTPPTVQPLALAPSTLSAVSTVLTPLSTLTAPSSPLQENRPLNHRPLNDRGVCTGPRARRKKPVQRPSPGGKPAPGLCEPPSPEQKGVDKLAQRKLRNKESARRYREKQVARRRQLENYTRTLTEQNRELEILHDRLLRLTCERRLGIETTDGLAQPNVL